MSLKERKRDLIKEFKRLLEENYKKDYNDNNIYVKVVDEGYLILDKTTVKNGVETRVFQKTDNPFKAKRYTFDEALEDYFLTNRNKYTDFEDIYKGLGVYDLSFNYSETQDVFAKYLDLLDKEEAKDND